MSGYAWWGRSYGGSGNARMSVVGSISHQRHMIDVACKNCGGVVHANYDKIAAYGKDNLLCRDCYDKSMAEVKAAARSLSLRRAKMGLRY